jgi:hypothetical protein
MGWYVFFVWLRIVFLSFTGTFDGDKTRIYRCGSLLVALVRISVLCVS